MILLFLILLLCISLVCRAQAFRQNCLISPSKDSAFYLELISHNAKSSKGFRAQLFNSSLFQPVLSFLPFFNKAIPKSIAFRVFWVTFGFDFLASLIATLSFSAILYGSKLTTGYIGHNRYETIILLYFVIIFSSFLNLLNPRIESIGNRSFSFIVSSLYFSAACFYSAFAPKIDLTSLVNPDNSLFIGIIIFVVVLAVVVFLSLCTSQYLPQFIVAMILCSIFFPLFFLASCLACLLGGVLFWIAYKQYAIKYAYRRLRHYKWYYNHVMTVRAAFFPSINSPSFVDNDRPAFADLCRFVYGFRSFLSRAIAYLLYCLNLSDSRQYFSSFIIYCVPSILFLLNPILPYGHSVFFASMTRHGATAKIVPMPFIVTLSAVFCITIFAISFAVNFVKPLRIFGESIRYIQHSLPFLCVPIAIIANENRLFAISFLGANLILCFAAYIRKLHNLIQESRSGRSVYVPYLTRSCDDLINIYLFCSSYQRDLFTSNLARAFVQVVPEKHSSVLKYLVCNLSELRAETFLEVQNLSFFTLIDKPFYLVDNHSKYYYDYSFPAASLLFDRAISYLIILNSDLCAYSGRLMSSGCYIKNIKSNETYSLFKIEWDFYCKEGQYLSA